MAECDKENELGFKSMHADISVHHLSANRTGTGPKSRRKPSVIRHIQNVDTVLRESNKQASRETFVYANDDSSASSTVEDANQASREPDEEESLHIPFKIINTSAKINPVQTNRRVEKRDAKKQDRGLSYPSPQGANQLPALLSDITRIATKNNDTNRDIVLHNDEKTIVYIHKKDWSKKYLILNNHVFTATSNRFSDGSINWLCRSKLVLLLATLSNQSGSSEILTFVFLVLS
jgi:hypothetical protein